MFGVSRKTEQKAAEPEAGLVEAEVSSRLAMLQADIEHLKEQVERDKRERVELDSKIAAVVDQVTEVRSLISSLEKQNAEVRVSAERSSAFIKAVQPEKLATELFALSTAVSELRTALMRHENQGKTV